MKVIKGCRLGVFVLALTIGCGGRKGTFDEFVDDVFVTVKNQDRAAYAKLVIPEKQEKLLAAWDNAVAEIKSRGIEPSTLAITKRDCRAEGDFGECNLTVEGKGKTLRIKVDDSKKTADGWRMVSYVRVKDAEGTEPR